MEQKKIRHIDFYEAYRLKILAENDLINQRMTWFIVLQSFLFISTAIASGSEKMEPFILLVFMGASIIGAISAYLAFISIGSALDAIVATRDRWVGNFAKIDIDVDSNPNTNPYGLLPALTGGVHGDTLSESGRRMPKLLPISIITFWAIVFSCSLLTLLLSFFYPLPVEPSIIPK